MKTIKSIFILVFFALTSNLALAGELDTLRFEVKGNCEMCKERIESSLDVKGVKSAVWDVDTKIIVVVYDKTKITEEKIHSRIAAAGHDTDKQTAPDKVYNKLPGCCKYDREIPEQK
ncbi:MAG: heavy-metal-associated domain-containing protein [Bacteroidia bacterium]